MTASEKAKKAGLKSLNVVAGMTGQSIQTLINWSKHKSALYDIVIRGCVASLEGKDEQ